MLGQHLRLAGVAERVAGEGQPGQPRQLQEHLGQSFEAVGGDAQQLQALQVGQAVRQGAQAVAGQRQLLQAGAVAQLGGQALQLVVGEDQPTQPRGQGGGWHLLQPTGLEADHLQLLALAEHFRQAGERIVRAEQHAQLAQARQVGRQVAQAVAGEVEHLQAVGEGEDLFGKFAQFGGQVQAADAGQFAAAQLFESVHGCLVMGPGEGASVGLQALLAGCESDENALGERDDDEHHADDHLRHDDGGHLPLGQAGDHRSPQLEQQGDQQPGRQHDGGGQPGAGEKDAHAQIARSK
ncbi:hypothetical protein D3C78_1104910 [compost metagenome]